ncbi:MAG: squalene/phytoene synthase family protein [Verrucomicrobiota bacterium]
MIGNPENQVLKGVSRSFYLSLRLLPRPMRGAASLGYLLARASDTLADSATLPCAARLGFLEDFRKAVAGSGKVPRWPVALLNSVPNARERQLLEMASDLVGLVDRLPAGEAKLVRRVVEIIISGQVLDLERFSGATREHPIALPDDAALDDYAWRVAGCVGEFWTELGFLTLGKAFAVSTLADLRERGIAYGKGLQLVNILRDVGEDLAAGRCYLPVGQPFAMTELLDCHARWLERATVWVREGERYAATLRSRRLRAATVLPAWIAQKTLEPLAGMTAERLRQRVKVPRSFVYRAMARAIWCNPNDLCR